MKIDEYITSLRKSLNITISVDDTNKLRLRGSRENVTQEIIAEVARRKEEIISFFNQSRRSTQKLSSAPLAIYYELSSNQRRVYFLQEFEKNSTGYNIQFAVRLKGQLDADKLNFSLNSLIARQESLRTIFEIVDGVPVQRILHVVKTSIEYKQCKEEDASQIIRDFVKPFDLAQAPLMRTMLLQVGQDEHILVSDLHHIITDGSSQSILMGDFMKIYNGEHLPSLPYQYKDYVHWQKLDQNRDVHREFWLKEFSGELEPCELPQDYPRPAMRGYEGDSVKFTLPKNHAIALRKLSQEENATLFMVLLSAFTFLLSKLSGREDVVVGTPVSGRPHADLEKVIGMFVNTVPMRHRVDGQLTFRQYLGQVRQRTLEFLDHQDFPYEELLDELRLQRDTSRNPLFDHMFAFENFERTSLDLPGLQVSPYAYDQRLSKFDLTLWGTERGEEIVMELEYSTKLFKRETVQTFVAYFERVIACVASNADGKVSDIDILSPDERSALINRWPLRDSGYDRTATLVSLFDKQVKLRPDEIAIVMDDQSLTYKELWDCSCKLAGYLVEHGAKHGELIVILADRSIETVTIMLGVLRAGCAYVPIDIEYPLERKEYIVKDSGSRLIVSSKGMDGGLAAPHIQTLFLESALQQSGRVVDEVPIQPSDLSYIIYTSGTTGNPKGVMIQHLNVVRLLFNDRLQYSFSERDVWTMFHSPCFDFSVWEMYGALLYGGKLVVNSRTDVRDPVVFGRLLERWGVTILNQTPGAFYNFAQAAADMKFDLSALSHVICGGEPLAPSRLKKWNDQYPHVKVINMYGITEITVHATYKEIGAQEIAAGVSNIGIPIPTLSIYLVDRFGQLSAPGTIGEICVAGDGVGLGYFGKEELTKTRFTSSPFRANERIYKSGDLARLMNNGDIEYLCRADEQIKIRGYRIEPGEIASKLLTHSLVRGAAVVCRQEGADKYLAAYYVSDDALTSADLRGYISERVPDYMLPSYFMRLDKLPLTVNGKLDKRALPEPVVEVNSYQGPRNEVEELLCNVWESVLGLARVGITDNFFLSGGDSIKSIQISSRVRLAGYDLSVRDIFTNQTIADLAPKLRRLTTKTVVEISDEDIELTPIQRWFFQKDLKDKHHFNQSVLLNFTARVTADDVREIFSYLVNHHDSLRLQFTISERGMVQKYGPKKDHIKIGVFDKALTERDATQLQSSMDLSTGPQLRVGLRENQLLIIFHHLVIDGVSWRILFEDIDTLYRQQRDGLPLSLSAKTASYQQWSSYLLHQYQRTPTAEVRISETQRLRRDNEGSNRYKDIKSQWFKLDEQVSRSLIGEVHHPFTTQVNDVLLTALLMALRDQYGIDSLAIDMESHGRNDVDGIDISRTMGWFTLIYPVLLRTDGHQSIDNLLRSVKDQLREAQSCSLDYFIEHSAKQSSSSILFNYLGQFDSDTSNKVYTIVDGIRGSEVNPEENRIYDWEVNGMLREGKLWLGIQYSAAQYDEDTIASVVSRFNKYLLQVTDYCKTLSIVKLSSSDVSYKQIGLSQLDALQEKYAIEDVYPLSPMQEGLLFHSMLDHVSGDYHEQMSFRLSGELDITLVRRSLQALINKYSILRTAFLGHQGQRPLQVVLKERTIDLNFEDLRGRNDTTDYINSFRDRERTSGFNMEDDVLMRLTVFQIENSRYEFVWSYHHILMDGWCMSIIVNDFGRIYASGGRGVAREERPYSEYIKWLEKRDRDSSKKYWSDYLAGFSVVTGLPRTRIETGTRTLAHHNFVLEQIELEKLQQLIGRSGVTLGTLLQTAWGVLLGRYNNTEDVVFGCVVSGRPAELAGVEKMVGLFINSVPVRMRWNGDMSVGELLTDVQNKAVESSNFHYQPLAEIQALTELGRNLVDHIIIIENYPVADNIKENSKDIGYTVESVQVTEQTNYDLAVVIMPEQHQLEFRIHFNSDVYDVEMIGNMTKHLRNVLSEIANNTDVKLSVLDVLDNEERQRLLVDFNSTSTDYPRNETVTALFRKQVLKNPLLPAIIYNDEHLTYEELDARSNKIANILVNEGIEVQECVGILVNGTINLVSSMLGIMKAAGVYLPLDEQWDIQAIRHVIKTSGIRAILTEGEFISALDNELKVLNVNQEHTKQTMAPEVNTSSESLIYVMYTSGSTGTPKGVEIIHRNVVRLVCNTNFIKFDESIRILQMGSSAFDAVTLEVWGPLLNGGCVVGVDKHDLIDSTMLEDIIKRSEANTMWMTNSLFEEYVRTRPGIFAPLKCIITGGDVINPKMINRFKEMHPHVNLIAGYGPTENTTFTTTFLLKEKQEGPVPIGKPIANTTAYVLDRHLRLQPIGVVGKLFVGGDGVARGYRNNPELTKDRFITNPFLDGDRLYDTGDMARVNRYGILDFFGREDNQVKIRGFRVELDDIQQRILEHPSITDTVITLKKENGNTTLAAYYISDSNISAEALQSFVANTLPAHMVPAYFIAMDQFPLTLNGKVNRKLLPDPTSTKRPTGLVPTDAREKKLTEVWSEILDINVREIESNSSFFEIGGQSIKAVGLINKVFEVFGVQISLSDVFRYPSIHKMSGVISEKTAIDDILIKPASKASNYRASPAQERMYYQHMLNPSSLDLNIIRAFDLTGEINVERLQASFEKLIARHDSLRTIFGNVDGELVQIIKEKSDSRITVKEIGNGETIDESVISSINVFNLAAGPLINCTLIVKEEKYVMIINIHHIICDGLSLNILMTDFKRIYNDVRLTPVKLRYADYSCWYHEGSQKITDSKKFWVDRLHDLKDNSCFSQTTSGKPGTIYEIETLALSIDSEVRDIIIRYTAQMSLSPYMFYLSVLFALKSRLTQTHDLLIGIDSEGRGSSLLRDVVGTFVTVLPIRVIVGDDISFADLLQLVKQTVLKAHEHQYYPPDLVYHLGGEQSPMINSHFSFGMDAGKERVNGLDFMPYTIHRSCRTSQYEFLLEGREEKDKVALDFGFSKELFDSDTRLLIVNYFYDILRQVIQTPSAPLSRIDLGKHVALLS